MTPATDARFGDYQTNIAMILARERRANPRALAGEIITRIEVGDCCEAPEIAGAGFIQFSTKAGMADRAICGARARSAARRRSAGNAADAGH